MLAKLLQFQSVRLHVETVPIELQHVGIMDLLQLNAPADVESVRAKLSANEPLAANGELDRVTLGLSQVIHSVMPL